LVGLRNLEEEHLRRLLEIWAIKDDNSICACACFDPGRAQPVVAYLKLVSS
jgi:hypothetical protein